MSSYKIIPRAADPVFVMYCFRLVCGQAQMYKVRFNVTQRQL